MPAISIVVPVYNTAPYLEACIQSLLGQTLRDIEILCYDDCSTDASPALLDRLAAADSRLHVVHYPENRTAAQARKDGALAAKGQYVLFVDGDDTLHPDACRLLLDLMRCKNADMIQFGTNVIADPEVPDARKYAIERLVAPRKGWLRGHLLRRCFVEEAFSYQIWNKIYRADLCKKAFSHFPDGRFSKAQDIFAFFLLDYFATSYFGAPELKLYNYYFGRGVTGRRMLTRAQLLRYAEQALVPQGIAAFLHQMNDFDAHAEAWRVCDQKLYQDAMAQLTHHTAGADFAYGFETMSRYWGAERVLAHLSLLPTQKRAWCAEQLRGCAWLPRRAEQVRTVGAFYHRLYGGGAQRVTAALARLWHEMGYHVVLFTDEPASPEDYPLPDGVTRLVLPSAQSAADQPDWREKRFKMLMDVIRERRIDLFVDHAWLSPLVLFDALAVQWAGAAFFVHTHSVFSMPLLTRVSHLLVELPSVYALAGGVLTLSETDACYWRHVNSNVFTLTNPLPFDLDDAPRAPLSGSQTVVWVGRLSAEKRPEQALEIFAKVQRALPGARLRLVGSGDAAMEEQLSSLRAQLPHPEQVEFCGYQTNVTPYYQGADALLVTSMYEGFCLTIAEAQSMGVPCVVYDMPYLTLLHAGKGAIVVPQEDVDEAAQALVRLLSDASWRARLGQEARENVRQCCGVDLASHWQRIFESAGIAHAMPEYAEGRLMLQALCDAMLRAKIPSSLPSEESQSQLRALARDLSVSPAFRAAPREIRAVGLYASPSSKEELYHFFPGWLALLARFGHRAVLFVEEEADVPALPPDVAVVPLPKSAGGKPSGLGSARFHRLYQALQTLNVDLFVHHQPFAPSALEDLLAARLAGAQVCLHLHSGALQGAQGARPTAFYALPSLLGLCDAVLCPNRADAAFLRHYHPHVLPCGEPIRGLTPSAPRHGKTVLWVGCNQVEKQPHHALDILRRLQEADPDIRLNMALLGENDTLLQALLHAKEKLPHPEGLHLSTDPASLDELYASADLLLCTSQFEGAAPFVEQALLSGLPCLSYAMPYLTCQQDDCGVVTVPMGDKDAAAARALALLLDPGALNALREKALARAGDRHKALAPEAVWPTLLSLLRQTLPPMKEDALRPMLDTLLYHGEVYLRRRVETKDVSTPDHRETVLREQMSAAGASLFGQTPQRGPCKAIRRRLRTASNYYKRYGLTGCRLIALDKFRQLKKKVR